MSATSPDHQQPVTAENTREHSDSHDRDTSLRQRLSMIDPANPRGSKPANDENETPLQQPTGVTAPTETVPKKTGAKMSQIFAMGILGVVAVGGAYFLAKADGSGSLTSAKVDSFGEGSGFSFGKMKVGGIVEPTVPKAILPAKPNPVQASVAKPVAVDLSAVADAKARAAKAEAALDDAARTLTEMKLSFATLQGDVKRLEAVADAAEQNKKDALAMQKKMHEADLVALRAKLSAQAATDNGDAAASAEEARKAREKEQQRLEAQRRSDTMFFDDSSPTVDGVIY